MSSNMSHIPPTKPALHVRLEDVYSTENAILKLYVGLIIEYTFFSILFPFSIKLWGAVRKKGQIKDIMSVYERGAGC